MRNEVGWKKLKKIDISRQETTQTRLLFPDCFAHRNLHLKSKLSSSFSCTISCASWSPVCFVRVAVKRVFED